MPNAKVLSEKQAIVAELTEKLKTASSGVLVDYKGITVAQDTALRAECRKNELDYAVVKNTLVRFAINNVGLEEMDSVLNGTTSLALSHGDPIAPMRVINKFAKQFNGEKFTIKAGFMDGKVLSLDEIKALAELPSKEVLQAQVLGTMLAPIHRRGRVRHQADAAAKEALVCPEGKELGSCSAIRGVSPSTVSQGRGRSTRCLRIPLVNIRLSSRAIRPAAPAFRVFLKQSRRTDRAIHISPLSPRWV